MITEEGGERASFERRGRATAVAAAAAATALETYDFVVYGFVAATIGRVFFPAKDPLTSLLSSFAVFGVGFLARPLGGVVIGRIADVRGRKTALMLSVLLMAIGTLLTGLVPGYAQIGALAPFLIVTARLLQGFAYGGGAGSGITFVVEWASQGRRGLYGGLQQCGVMAGGLAGSLIAALCIMLIAKAPFDVWGWRIPFILGALILPLGLYMRNHVGETPIFVDVEGRRPARGEYRLVQIGQAFGITMLWTSATYIFLSYMPTFTTDYIHLASDLSLWANSLGLSAVLVAIPLFGYLSDRIGRRPILMATSAAFVLLPYPMLRFAISHGSFGTVCVIQIIFGALLAAMFAVCPATLSEIFPTRNRTILISVSYGVAVAIFGGFAPFVVIWLIRDTGSVMAPAFYVMANAVVTGIVSFSLPETFRIPLR